MPTANRPTGLCTSDSVATRAWHYSGSRNPGGVLKSGLKPQNAEHTHCSPSGWKQPKQKPCPVVSAGFSRTTARWELSDSPAPSLAKLTFWTAGAVVGGRGAYVLEGCDVCAGLEGSFGVGPPGDELGCGAAGRRGGDIWLVVSAGSSAYSITSDCELPSCWEASWPVLLAAEPYKTLLSLIVWVNNSMNEAHMLSKRHSVMPLSQNPGGIIHSSLLRITGVKSGNTL